ncbi:hypothetical protein SFC34_26840 [Priestia aryabhattai]|uniref:hypothetical protein n=1 Tax=Priestia aryabhattai TaxID=412384 RepID=UPI0039821858
MVVFDERVLKNNQLKSVNTLKKEEQRSKTLLFDEKEMDKQIDRAKKKNPFSLLQPPKDRKEKKKEKLPGVKKSVADIIPIIDQKDSGLFQLKDVRKDDKSMMTLPFRKKEKTPQEIKQKKECNPYFVARIQQRK